MLLWLCAVLSVCYTVQAFRCAVQYPRAMQGLVRCITSPTPDSGEPVAEAEGHVVLVPEVQDCRAYDAQVAVRGGIALVHRGRCTFAAKAAHARAAGAVGMVLINSDDDLSFFLQVRDVSTCPLDRHQCID